jgi:alkylhydroperoxidase family enzyme
VEAVLRDYRSAPIGEKEAALFAFVEKVALDTSRVRREDVEEAKAAGWSEEALYDAVTVTALFRFYNTWIDGTGVSDMTAPLYEASGKRLAELGYAPPAGKAP